LFFNTLHYLRLIGEFFKVSTQAEMAYRANFFIRILNALLNLVTGVLSLTVIFNQAESIKGWELPSAMALLGVYLLLTALRGLFISPSLESVAGMDGETWQRAFDFTLLRPVDKQFLVSFRYWRVLMLFDLALALGVLGFAIYLLEASLDFLTIIPFILTLAAGVILLYSALLAFSALAFWNSGFLFTWVINNLFQLTHYPVGLMTTIPAQSLSGTPSWEWLLITLGFATVVLLDASWLFRQEFEKYTSASS
jgi:ABC-2 type transport system permease protein